MTETGPCPDREGEELEVNRQQRAQKPQPGKNCSKQREEKSRRLVKSLEGLYSGTFSK